jgi:hypothetical protein
VPNVPTWMNGSPADTDPRAARGLEENAMSISEQPGGPNGRHLTACGQASGKSDYEPVAEAVASENVMA